MVIVVRKDIKLSPGKMAAQVAHAAVNCALIAKKRSPMYFDAWYNEGQKKAVLKEETSLRSPVFMVKPASLMGNFLGSLTKAVI